MGAAMVLRSKTISPYIYLLALISLIAGFGLAIIAVIFLIKLDNTFGDLSVSFTISGALIGTSILIMLGAFMHYKSGLNKQRSHQQTGH